MQEVVGVEHRCHHLHQQQRSGQKTGTAASTIPLGNSRMRPAGLRPQKSFYSTIQCSYDKARYRVFIVGFGSSYKQSRCFIESNCSCVRCVLCLPIRNGAREDSVQCFSQTTGIGVPCIHPSKLLCILPTTGTPQLGPPILRKRPIFFDAHLLGGPGVLINHKLPIRVLIAKV